MKKSKEIKEVKALKITSKKGITNLGKKNWWLQLRPQSS